MSKVVIIGGGFAGLSAAVFLSDKKHTIHLLEASPKLGGRAFSFLYKNQNDEIDNGQHIMMGCYKNTIEFLKLIGSFDKLFIQNNLEITFLGRSGETYKLESPNRIYPFNLLFALMNYRAVPLRDRLKILKLFLRLPFENNKKLANLSLNDWLKLRGQNERTRKALWDILCIGTLNTKPENADAEIFVRILKKIFLAGNKSTSIVIPGVGLSSLYCEPSVKFIERNNGIISTSEKVIDVITSNGVITKIITDKGEISGFDYVVSAAPYFAYKKIFKMDSQDSEMEFEYSPIVSMHLWLDSNPFKERFYGLIDSKVHWIFNHGKYITLVTSDAGELVNKDNEQILALFADKLIEFFPQFAEAEIIDYKFIKEKRATFIPSISIKQVRKNISTPYKNLFIAGDWTDTGLPSTIESAVLSGRLVSEKIFRN